MKSILLAFLSVSILLSTAACTKKLVKGQTLPDTPYTAPKAEIPVRVTYIPPFPEFQPKNEQEALGIFNIAADAYSKCIIELTAIKTQDEIIRGNK